MHSSPEQPNQTKPPARGLVLRSLITHKTRLRWEGEVAACQQPRGSHLSAQSISCFISKGGSDPAQPARVTGLIG